MKVIEPYIEIIDDINANDILFKLEKIGRVCYKSEHNISDGSAAQFIDKIIKSGHESVIEHESISIKVICDRGVSHEIVRHRIASYSQESTRYCNYTHDKFNNEITVIKPSFWNENSHEYATWILTMEMIEKNYFKLIELGAKPEEARSILPNSLKTEIVMTMNLREWRHFFKLRTSKRAHPQMRQIAVMIYERLSNLLPILFCDINPSEIT